MFSWNDYSIVAARLQKYSKSNFTITEGFLRSAVSRAYYAAYHAALDYAKSKGYVEKQYRSHLKSSGVRDLGSHGVLIRFLLDDSAMNVKQLGTNLDTCRYWRTECDYNESTIINDRYTTLARKSVDGMLSLINTLP